ncbi:MAG: hypothetical protein KUG74_07940 [Rhodobacteraceae bacterium]|nr:hypothetical protein [Paracoccaceae bacterium]
METGIKISLVAHCTLIGLALFGSSFRFADDIETIRISEVSLMTSSEFEAMTSRSPAPVIEQPEQIQPALPSEDSVIPPVEESAPKPPVQPLEEHAPSFEETPDVTGLQEPEFPELEVESPTLAPQANDSVGNTLVLPDSPVLDQQMDGARRPDQLAMMKPQPRPAPRIDTRAAEKPPTDAETAEQAQQATTPDAAATQQVDKVEEQAPKEATTEIVSEPEFDPNSTAPAKSSRPRGRPRDIARKAQQAKDKAEKVAAQKARAAKEAEAQAIRDALIQATAEALNSAPTGPPLTFSEREGLVLAVQECWNVPAGLENAGDLVVVLSVDLSKDGDLTSSPRLIDPAGSARGTILQAFEAGRRALIRCAPYDLPQDKYEQWRQLEVVFNPKKMVVK